MNINELQKTAGEVLDAYEKYSGVPEFSIFDDTEVSKYFNMKSEQLNAMSSVQCAEAAYMLAQYSFYLQRLYNRESATHRWAQDQLNKLVCDKMNNYPDFTKYDHKIALIAKENSVVERLHAIMTYTEQVMDRLNFLSSSLKNMCDMMSNIQKAKSFKNRATNYEH